MKHYFLFLILLCASYGLFAQATDSVSVIEDVTVSDEDSTQNEKIVYELEKNDTVHTKLNPKELSNTASYKSQSLPIKKFDQKKWKSIVGATNYEEKPDSNESKAKAPVIPTNAAWNSPALRIILYILIVCIIVYLLYYFSMNISSGTKLNKQTLRASDLLVPIDNIDDLDIQKWLQQTLADGNLRLAVRICYLGLLKKLNENKKIVWKKNKTNHDYLSELLAKNFYVEEVTGLTLAYEQVWYGEHTLTKKSFDLLFEDFERVQQKIDSPTIS